MPDRAEQIAKMFGVDTSKLETPATQANTIPFIDRYHEFFMAKAANSNASEDSSSDGESVVTSSEDSSSDASSESDSDQDTGSSMDDFVIN